ncbi:fimbrial protein [Shewanella algae]|uniref:fimbrial protein n=1 Tax=Shewanella algae TaxID=38313 RepID=UPI001AAD5071|nr:fimbrial protein [Shewanella algae]MBO2651606.1 type 1 fimbrial protein [Shewanella algae]
MKKLTLAFAVSGALLGSSAAMAAGPNTITFQGEVTAETCEVTINGNTANPVVLLPSVSKTELSDPGATAGETIFTLGVTGCSGASAISTKTKFVGNNVDTNGNLANTGTATNVALQLLDAAGGTAINLNTDVAVTGVALAIGETEGSVDYAVQYISVAGGATAGTVAGSVQYAISYL